MDTTQKVFAGGALLASLTIGFKAELLNWFKNELTVWRFLLVCSLIGWTFWAVRRFVILPIHRKIDDLAKQQLEYTLNFNREQHARIQLEKRVAALDGIKE